MFLILTALAVANDPLPETQGDFLSPSRTDAPTDGVLLFAANFELSAEVVEGPGAPFSLSSTPLLDAGWSDGYAVTFANPSGWEAGAAYVVEVPTQDEQGLGTPASLSFTVGSAPAAAPSAPLVTDVRVDAWNERDFYPSGCCAPTRRVTFEVESTSDDPWAYVELKGLFDGDSPYAEDPVLQRLDLSVGPGTHTLSFVQWEEDGALHPPAFEIAAVSASGERGAPQRIDIADDTTEEAPASAICGTHGAVAFAPLGLALLLVRRRGR